MSNQKDPLAGLSFDLKTEFSEHPPTQPVPVREEFGQIPDPAGTDVPDEEYSSPGDTLDQSEELEAESEEITIEDLGLDPTTPHHVQLLALETARAERAKMERQGTHTSPIRRMSSASEMVNFINKTRRMKKDAIEDKLVNDSIPVMLWKLREYALQGKYTETRAIEIWLNWADRVAARPKEAKADKQVLKNGALFDATLTQGQVLETQAKEVKERQRAGNFGKAGDFIGKHKAPRKEKKK